MYFKHFFLERYEGGDHILLLSLFRVLIVAGSNTSLAHAQTYEVGVGAGCLKMQFPNARFEVLHIIPCHFAATQ